MSRQAPSTVRKTNSSEFTSSMMPRFSSVHPSAHLLVSRGLEGAHQQRRAPVMDAPDPEFVIVSTA
jgi:hypothetical protein